MHKNSSLTIRGSSDRQRVSDAGLEIGEQAYFLSLNLLRGPKSSRRTTTSSDFLTEQVLCSLSAGSKVTLKCERVSDFALSRDCQPSENKETIGPSNGREDRLVSEKIVAHLRVFKKATQALSEGPLTSPWSRLPNAVIATHPSSSKRGEKEGGGEGVRLRGEKGTPPMTIDYLLSKRTNGANPFKIFEALEKCDQQALSQYVRRLQQGGNGSLKAKAEYQPNLSSILWES